MKIALLCNNTMALPALQALERQGMLCAVATTGRDADVVRTFTEFIKGKSYGYTTIASKGHKEALNQWVRNSGAEVVFVMSYTWRIPKETLAIPRMGFINFHPGLLPEMRGADPVFETIRQRKPVAGVTAHIMDEQFDTGAILMREEMPVADNATYGMLAGQLARMTSGMVAKMVDVLKTQGLPQGMPQDETKAQYWPKVGIEALTVNWKKMSASEITTLVRACNPVGKGIPVTVNGWQFLVSDATEIKLQGDASAIMPGTVLANDPQNGLIICSTNGMGVKVDVVQTAEGIFPGHKLAAFGLGPGMVFN